MSEFPEGYSVLVIGAAAGIGRQTALHLAERGVAVTVADRDEEGAARVAAEIRDAGGTALAALADVTDPASVRSAVLAAVDGHGDLHGVVNSAGVQGPLGRPSHEVEIDDFERTVRINLTAGLVIAREVIPFLLERGYGRVVHVASIGGKEGNPNMVAYSASKAGLIGLVKAQGKEYAQTGVTVNAVAPAVIRTPFLDSQPREVVDYMLQRIPMGRMGETSEVAATIAFAVSPACSFTTGFTFDVSGGRATY
ncbi:SDR family NAD(P)-dependent oxidoreductase [Galbitalea sp. SE-J8]|uniref:SDR family NAD(P)-dependent oxidoreductase n=1 Tax=Galbitalea sp. SE-J8 TaxID=3054952 RepID=UPI00259C96C2|nr:SDR family NAD(P)-dependent oxidoreductase [Galbitalea sp. SE-J8]MDM4761997.1 SDR family NAD(P)-dependent oxidoreductase [Galbitalea sp. SE-J8]